MSTLGYTSATSYGFGEFSSGVRNQLCDGTVWTFPSGGPWRITNISGYLNGWGQNSTAYFAVWNTSGSLLCSTGGVTVYNHAGGRFNQDWYTGTVSGGYVVPGGTQVRIGWYVAGQHQYGFDSGNAYFYKNASGLGAMTGYGTDSRGSIHAYVTYVQANQAPTAATVNSVDGHLNGWVIGYRTHFVWSCTGHDPDAGDVLAKYDWELYNTSGFNAALGSSVATGYNWTGGISGQGYSFGMDFTPTKGNWYAMRTRTYDDSGAQGPWSAVFYIRINADPTCSVVSPSNSLATITNITEASMWTGSEAKCSFNWSYSSATGVAQSHWSLQVATDSGFTNKVVDIVQVPGTGTSWASTVGFTNSTQYYWRVQVRDGKGQWSSWTAAAGFKVRWTQVAYEFGPDTPPGQATLVGTANWTWSFGTSVPTGSQLVILYGSGDSAGTAGVTWKTSVSSVGVAAYAKVLFRMTTSNPTQVPNVSWMKLTYLGSGQAPDRWVLVSGSNPDSEWSLASSTRRFGTVSLQLDADLNGHAGNRYAYPDRDIPVIEGVTYTFSAYLKLDAALSGSTQALIAIFRANSLGETLAVSDPVTDTSTEPDGWKRLQLQLTVPPGNEAVRPLLWLVRNSPGAGNTKLWWDGVRWEEGKVATTWTPSLISDAAVLDTGVMVDKSMGGIFRLRGESGTPRDEIELGPHGFVFGSDTHLYSDTKNRLVIPDLYGSSDPPRLLVGDDAEIFDVDDVDAIGIRGAINNSNAKLVFGGDKDTSLYRAAANVLKTDDRLDWPYVGGLWTIGSTAISSGAWSPLTPAGESQDSHGFWSSGTHFTVPTGLGGWYLVVGEIFYPSNTAGRRLSAIRINGETDPSWQSEGNPSSVGYCNLQVHCLQMLSAASYIELCAYAGTALTITGAKLSMARIGY